MHNDQAHMLLRSASEIAIRRGTLLSVILENNRWQLQRIEKRVVFVSGFRDAFLDFMQVRTHFRQIDPWLRLGCADITRNIQVEVVLFYHLHRYAARVAFLFLAVLDGSQCT